MKKIIIVSILVLLYVCIILSSGEQIKVSKNNYKIKFFNSKKIKNLPELSYSIIKTSEVNSLEAFVVSGGSRFKKFTASQVAILVNHPKGSFLFDIGLGENYKTHFRESVAIWNQIFMKPKFIGSVKAQLLKNKYNLQTIKFIILSHLHWDHSSGIEDFPGTPIWITKQEFTSAEQISKTDYGYIRSHFKNKNIKWKFINLKNEPYKIFEKSFDIFQDGSVILVSIPGHTKGSLGMILNFPSGKLYFFTSDTTWSMKGFTDPAEKFWYTRIIADQDRELTKNQIILIHELMRLEKNIIIIPAHDDLYFKETFGYFPKTII